MRHKRSRNDQDDNRRTGTPAPAEASIAVLHPLIRLLARQAARDCFDAHISARRAEVPTHDDDPI